MKISVVTVCLNSEKTIALTIESFLKQTYPHKELLIIDGVSEDRTIEIAQSFACDAVRIFSERDRGIYDAMNRGLRWFSGDAVGFLNSDDTFHSDRSLDLIARGLGTAEIVFGDLYMVADHQTKRAVRTWRAGEFTPSAFRLGWVPPHPTFYMKRDVVQGVGEFDERYRIASDYDYMLRAMMVHRYRVQYVPHFLVDYQMGGASSRNIRDIIKANFEFLDSRRRHLRAWPVDAAFFMRPLRRLFQVSWLPARVQTRD